MTSDTKTVFLLRHAQAAYAQDGNDKNRKLSQQGQQDAIALGRHMLAQSFTPDFILCSDAQRTRETLECAQKSHPALLNTQTSFSPRLYSGSTGDYFALLQEFDEKYPSALVIAHNPSIYDLVRYLSGYGADHVQNRLLEGYATATISEITLKSQSWKDIQPGENELKSISAPIDYNAPERPTRWM